MNLDQALGYLDTKQYFTAAFKCLDALYGEPTGVQVCAFACLFSHICQEHDLNPRTTLEKVERAIKDALTENNQHVRAVKAYMHGETKDA